MRRGLASHQGYIMQQKRHLIYTLAALATFGLAAPGVYAQSLILHSGDRVTVDRTGTHGVLHGHPVNNKITSYTSSGSVRGVDEDAVQINGTAVFTLGTGGTVTGGSNGIALEVLENGRVTITGGTISCRAPSAAVPGEGSGLSVGGKSRVTIRGGTIIGGQYGPAVAVEDDGVVLVNSGTITGQYGPALAPEGSGTVTVIGGTITTNHGAVGLLVGGTNGTLNLFSGNKPFLVNDMTLNDTSLAANSSGTLSGTLANGQFLHTTFLNGGHIHLNLGKSPTLTSKP